MTDALTVVEDPLLDSLGAFLAASLVRADAPASSAAPEAPAALAPGRDATPGVERAPTVLPDRPPEIEPSAPPTSRLRLTLEWVAIIGGALVLALVIRIFVIQSFAIPSESMHPTLENGDRVLVNRLAYRAHDIRRGDVIVFRRPANANLGKGAPEHLIKRVIGLPGDTIVAQNGIVFVDGRELREPYVPAGTLTDRLDTPVTIPAGHVWVMGDNRMNSTDSRVFGPINIKLVVGRAFARVWPPSRAGFL